MECFLNLVICFLLFGACFALYMFIRESISYDLLREHEKRQNREEEGQPKKPSRKRNDILLHLEVPIRFLFCLPTQYGQEGSKSGHCSGYGFGTVSAMVKRFVVNVCQKVFGGLAKIKILFNFRRRSSSIVHSDRKFPEPIVNVDSCAESALSPTPCSAWLIPALWVGPVLAVSGAALVFWGMSLAGPEFVDLGWLYYVGVSILGIGALGTIVASWICQELSIEHMERSDHE
jgi:hypothetical protein